MVSMVFPKSRQFSVGACASLRISRENRGKKRALVGFPALN